jgi:hypothetical protein
VRSNEGNLIGNVDAADENSILVSTELNIQKAKLERFKGAAGEGFREINHYSSVYFLLLHFILFSLFTQIAFGTGQTSKSTIINGGGTVGIGCPDGSTVDTVVSFVAEKLSNGTIAGNWTIDSIEDVGVSMNGFSFGPIYQGNLSMEHFNIQGETYNQQEEINLCASPVFAPISLTGQCGQDVMIIIQFQSNDPLDTPNSFSADVECQSV